MDGDMNLPLHVACKTVGQPWSRQVVMSKRSGVQVYNADFGHRSQPKDDLTLDLIRAYPDAVQAPDDSGKVPFVLAVESAKPWETSLRPLWEHYHLDDEQFALLEKALQASLTSMSSSIRDGTVATLKHIAPLWPRDMVNDVVLQLIELCCDLGASWDSNEAWSAAIHASALQGLAQLLKHVDKAGLEVPGTPQQALDVSLKLLASKRENVRDGAARVVGAALAILGIEATEAVMRELIFPVSNTGSDPDQDDHSISTTRSAATNWSVSSTRTMSTMGFASSHSVSPIPVDLMPSEEDDFAHGRAMACYYILNSDSVRLLTAQQRVILKQLLKHDSSIVRAGACWAVGSSLRSVIDLKEFRSHILKCMRPTEDPSVHLALAQSLTVGARKQEKLFLCKAGLPLLDGALMLSMSRGTAEPVRLAFDSFLWYALQQQESGLQEYMDLAEGENGRIMMSLVTKKLTRMPVVEEGDEV
jgi:hypothetical protein